MGPWQLAWFLGVYVSLFLCIYACLRIGYTTGWARGLFNLFLLVLFAICHWLLESWANLVAPFYTYPQSIFPDMIPHFDFSTLGFSSPEDLCAQQPSRKVSATIPLSGSIITFCLMWTARLLLTTSLWKQPYRPLIVPLMAALAALLVDLFMDPVLAISNSCDPMVGIVHQGMGYWDWFTRPSFVDFWFHVPLFNYANWYAFPGTMAAIAVLLGWLHNAITSSNWNTTEFLLYSFIILCFSLVMVTAPDVEPPLVQFTFIVIVIAISLYFIYRDWGTYKRNNPFRWEFVLPILFYAIYSLAALFFSGVFPLSSSLLLILAVLVGVLVVGWWITRPYIP